MWRRSYDHKLVNENFHKFLASIARVYPPTDHDEMQAQGIVTLTPQSSPNFDINEQITAKSGFPSQLSSLAAILYGTQRSDGLLNCSRTSATWILENCIAREVIFQRIRSHCDFHGNEQADKLAEEALTLYLPCQPIPLRNVKRLIRGKCRQKRISTLK
ncbi:hypothetical protein TNCV_3844471 [Trichonephila clavipes]|nr:hypothetical protein TNCV_3844471 [Trichonephila clavipes]